MPTPAATADLYRSAAGRRLAAVMSPASDEAAASALARRLLQLRDRQLAARVAPGRIDAEVVERLLGVSRRYLLDCTRDAAVS